MRKVGVTGAVACTLAASAFGGGFDSGSDGSDGPLILTPNTLTTINLNNAAQGPWDMPSPVPGQGIYDPDLWVVVFKYTSIDIPGPSFPGPAIVRFENHESEAPVVWLASGNVTIAGNVELDGAPGGGGGAFVYSQPGPGGFAGGSGNPNSAGFGPGGGAINFAGSYNYGNVGVVPLIGGSGGGAGINGSMKGGAGGGAILLASSGTINVLSRSAWQKPPSVRPSKATRDRSEK